MDSLFEQDYPKIELIISDDGSPNIDSYSKSICDYIEDNKKDNIIDVKYNFLEKNGGTVKNVNSALDISSGYYIKELGADDTLNGEDALTKYVDFLEDNDVNICFSKLQGVTEEGEIVRYLSSCADDYDVLSTMNSSQIANRLYARNFLPAPAWCARKSLFTNNGKYDERMRLIEDYPYWIKLALNSEKFGFMEDVLINYKMSGVSSTGSYGMAFMEDLLKIYELYIFPNDKRYGIAQGMYNMLKRMGLNTYIAKAKWKGYSINKRVLLTIKYLPFFVYIWINETKMKIKNRK